MTVQSVSGGIGTGWRTPAVVLVVGSIIAMVSFGPRSALGFFLTPMSQDFHWGRDVFSMALAIQNLMWGVGQPFAGGLADRYGANEAHWGTAANTVKPAAKPAAAPAAAPAKHRAPPKRLAMRRI